MPYTIEALCELGMPIAMVALVEAASKRKTVTYKDIAERIQPKLRSPIALEHIGWVVGGMMHKIHEIDQAAPPLNALCVNSVTKLPGDGAHEFIKTYNRKIDYKNLSNPEKREMLLPVYEDVFNFKKWPLLAHNAFNINVGGHSPQEQQGETEGKARRLGYGGPAESDEHRRLKEFVKNNPRRFDAPVGCKEGVIEKRLRSLDEIDVWFVSPGQQLAVEVKSHRSVDLDLERGIYQCVKYRAILEAENKAEKIRSTVRACLVSERKLPNDLARLAKLFDIEVKITSSVSWAVGIRRYCVGASNGQTQGAPEGAPPHLYP